MDCLSLQEKIAVAKKNFCSLSVEKIYQKLIEMGRKLPPFPDSYKTAERKVQGCQSSLYLYSFARDGKIFFQATADALISAGLAALLIEVYNGEAAETILKCPPDFLKELGIYASLSPNRSNGLAHLYLHMKREAFKSLLP